MEISRNNTTPANSYISKFEADRFALSKFSRWKDENGKSRILLDFWYGGDPETPGDNRSRRIGIDLLIVDEEQSEYLKIADFINLIETGKMKRWNGKAKEKLSDVADDIQFNNQSPNL